MTVDLLLLGWTTTIEFSDNRGNLAKPIIPAKLRNTMADDDFDINSLAAYLHITPQQVEKLANRDEIPSRRVGGKLRFALAEVHHWMEKRMGLLDDVELAKVESRLDKQGGTIQLSQLLQPAAVAVPLAARTRASVIKAMTDVATQSGMLWDPDKLAAAVRAREEMQSTAMDNGAALLHPRRPLPGILEDGFVALGVTSQGIPFGGSRQLTDVFWLICSVDDRSHLQTLARISRLMTIPEFLPTLRNADDATAAYDCVTRFESELEVNS